MDNKLGKVETNLQELLNKKPQLNQLEKRRELIWEYWKTYDGLQWGLSKEMWMFRITWPDYITRALRKLLVKDKKLDTQRPEREEAQKEFRKTLSPKEQEDFEFMFGKAHCTKCGDDILGDEDSLCGNCSGEGFENNEDL